MHDSKFALTQLFQLVVHVLCSVTDPNANYRIVPFPYPSNDFIRIDLSHTISIVSLTLLRRANVPKNFQVSAMKSLVDYVTTICEVSSSDCPPPDPTYVAVYLLHNLHNCQHRVDFPNIAAPSM